MEGMRAFNFFNQNFNESIDIEVFSCAIVTESTVFFWKEQNGLYLYCGKLMTVT